MSAKPLSVAVLISAGRHPVSAAPRACRSDSVAMALGRKLAGVSVRIVHAGDPHEPALNDYLAYGAGKIEVLNVSQGNDALSAIAQHVKTADLILTGHRAENGEGSGLLPYLLAHALDRPIIADALDVHIENNDVRVRQFLPKGKRRMIAAPLPLVLAVHPLAPATLTYAHARRIAGRIETITATGSPSRSKTTAWTIEPGARRPNQLKAPENRDGHARMVSYVESQAKGGAIIGSGSSIDKAQILLSYLRENRLIDF